MKKTYNLLAGPTEIFLKFKDKNIDYSQVDVLIAPPYISLYPMYKEIKANKSQYFIISKYLYER